tara:strand:+ start:438 stop:713 length:276 start_codon:yes stop_codon:yes gene_type:complete
MNIKTIEEGTICHYCRQEFNGTEEGLVQMITDGEAFYHLRCIGKLCVYRIEGVIPQHLFVACIEELNKPLPDNLKDKTIQVTLDAYNEEEE